MAAADMAEALGLDRLPVRNALSRLRQRGLVCLAGMVARHSPHWGDDRPAGMWEAVPTE